ncbi:MAG: RHS domain-containing protein [Deltaproteobacteria bacterium]|nr:RHS domain-containing protein [Deltaproteobacteria bacterium]
MSGDLFRRLPFIILSFLFVLLTAGTAAWPVTFHYDEQERLIKALYQNGTIVEYSYDSTGNRLTRTIRTPLPPVATIGTTNHLFCPKTWSGEHTLCGTATDRSGTGLEAVEVSIRRKDGSPDHYWNGTDWSSPAEVWLPATHGLENWRYHLNGNVLQNGGEYLFRARSRDRNGRHGLSEPHAFTFDSAMPAISGAVRVVNSTILELRFTEPVTGAEDVSSYHISGGLSIVKVVPADEKTFQIYLSSPIQPGAGYSLRISEISDLAGNSVDPAFNTLGVENHVPVAPGINFPASQEEVKGSQPLLSLNNGFDPDGDMLSYTFQVSRDQDFRQLVAHSEGIAEGLHTTEWQVDVPLDENTQYWWRVRACDGNFFSPWCASTLFVNTQNDPPTRPIPRWPVEGAHVAAQCPSIEVGKSSDPDLDGLTYEFQVFRDEAMTDMVFSAVDVVEGPNGGALCLIGTPLTDNVLYYWRARAKDNEQATSNWTDAASFRVNLQNDAPSAPSILAPGRGQEIEEDSPLLELRNSTDADYDVLTYCVELDTTEAFTGPGTWRSPPLPEGIGARSAFSVPVPLSDNTLYYWRARAFDGKAYSPWACDCFFVNRKNDPPEAPKTLEPFNTTVNDASPVLRVSIAKDLDLDEVSYKFEVCADPGMLDLVIAEESSRPLCEIRKALEHGRDYFWRACAVDEHGLAGPWSDTARFKVASSAQPPPAPIVNSPVHMGFIVSLPASLSVYTGPHGTRYQFELYSDYLLNHLLDSSLVDAGKIITSWFPTATLKDGTTYHWRCRALNGSVPGPWGPTTAFTVSTSEIKAEIQVEARQRAFSSGGDATRIEVNRDQSPIRGTGIEIPAGALTEDHDISIGVVKNPPALPAYGRHVGRVVDFGPDGILFRKEVSVYLRFEKDDLERAGIADLAELTILTFTRGEMRWEEVPVDQVDNENLFVLFKVKHFSMFAAVKTDEERSYSEGVQYGQGEASGCFISGLCSKDELRACWIVSIALLLVASLGIRRRILRVIARRSRLMSATFLLLPLLTSQALATSASIAVSENEGAIPLSASAAFTGYTLCDPPGSTNCTYNDTGTLYVYQGSTLLAQVNGSESAEWSTTLNGGAMAQGEHLFEARAVDSQGICHSSQTHIVIDNTPAVTVNSPGLVEGAFDITGTVQFKQNEGGLDGQIQVYIDTQDYRYAYIKTYEGTTVTWSFSEVAGHLLNAGAMGNGEHKVYVLAKAANGTYSQWAEATFEVTLLSRSKNLGDGCGICKVRPRTTGPINFATGNKYRKEKDLDLGGPGLPMGFLRCYNSQSTRDTAMGYGWSASFSEHITFQSGRVVLHEADGAEVHFIDNGQGKFLSETDKLRMIEPLLGGGYFLTEPDGRSLHFDGTGKLLQVTDRNGNTQDLGYSSGRIASVEDNFGRRLDFIYNPDGRLAYLGTPTGQYAYTYDSQGNLSTAQKPDLTAKTYLYEDPNDLHNLTGIINERSIRSLTVEYDAEDRAVLSQGPGGAKRVTIAYDNNFVRHVTDSMGRTSTFKLHVDKGIARVKQVAGHGCASCLGSLGENYEFDERLYVTRETDAGGLVTALAYDDRGNVLTQKEAAGTPDERITTYTYHPSLNLVTSITKRSVANPDKNMVTTFTYDERGNLLGRTESGFSGSLPVTSAITYTYNSFGQITGVDGPRSDVNDISILEYYPNTPDQGLNRGRLMKITNALGHETFFSQYNRFGYPERIVDINGNDRLLSYDLRGRLVSRSLNGLETRYDYDTLGNLTAITLPAGRKMQFLHNQIKLLERIQDQEGNHIRYIYDTEGNKVAEEIRDRDDILRKAQNLEYDEENRLKRVLYPDGASESMTYDETGNMLSQTDPCGRETRYAYDGFKRLTMLTEPGDITTSFTYDHRDNLVSVVDARNNTTTYTYDDLGRIIQTSSPDTGTTTRSYDESDNLVSSNDARDVTATYQYDPLSRLTQIQFADPSESITFGHDQGPNGKGRITNMVDPTGRTDYSHDAFGRVIEEKRTVDGITHITHYTYDGNGGLSNMTYPSGLAVEYERDAAGRIKEVKVNGQAFAHAVAYLPFGPVSGLVMGNDLLSLSKAYDQRYRLSRIYAGPVMDYNYTYDPAGNILSISGVTEPNPDGDTSQYEYAGNRLISVTDREQRPCTYDGAGNMVSDGFHDFAYNHSGRLVRVSKGGVVIAEYTYDGLARRVRKTVSGKTTLFHYDRNHNLISETDSVGNPLRDIIYMNGERIAMKLYGNQEGIYYFLNDHLGTPHMIIKSTGEIVWHAAYLPFGEAQILTEKITNPFRFPGQYFDAETGLHYNYFRYYNPKTGRYLTPDPIGIKGGINTFAYGHNNPTRYYDIDGQLAFDYHFLLTLAAALNNGMGLKESMALAWKAMAVDFQEGADSTDCDTTKKHAMAGEIFPGIYQSSEEALSATKTYIAQCIASNDLAQAIHAAQDLATPAHAGKEWHGFGLNLESFLHLIGDSFPLPGTLKKAYINTTETIRQTSQADLLKLGCPPDAVRLWQ